MRLDTISKIEQFISDALLSSPNIPLGVNVVRLAATTDEEGITALARSTVVRYVSSSISVTNRTPMVVERTMSFQLIHSAQSYLTESGHDYALQMCAGAYLTLNNTVPMDTGVSVLEPFSMSSEQFDGLTDSSHYVYVQTWNLTVQEINRLFALDPCVLRGNCSYLFPSNLQSTVQPGDVVEGNQLFTPVLPPDDPDDDYDSELCGVIVEGDDLVYKHDPSVMFLQNWEDHYLTSTGTYTPNGLLICNIFDKDDDYVDVFMASNCDNRRFISITNTTNGESGVPALKAKMTWGYTSKTRVVVHSDPTSPDQPVSTMRYGFVLRVETGVTLEVGPIKYHKVSGSPIGNGWVNQDHLILIEPYRLRPLLFCEGLDAENDGPEECT